MFKFNLSCFLVVFCAHLLSAQSSIWSISPQNADQLPIFLRSSPQTVAFADLDEAQLKINLQLAGQVLVDLPILMPNGNIDLFEVREHSIMEAGLQAKFPQIKTYKGYKKGDSGVAIRLSVTGQGLDAMITTAGQAPIIVQRGLGQTSKYLSYRRTGSVTSQSWECAIKDFKKGTNSVSNAQKGNFSDCKYRTYRLALACTGEYATFHGGTIMSVMSAMVVTMTRVNAILEDEVGIHLNMVSNNNTLISLNAASDPFTNSDGVAMLSENQTEVDTKIGTTNYDIGHVFSTGGGGVAYGGAVCFEGFKAGGVTGLGSPIGDAFDVDYVAHEMGHQFSANHTMSNDCNRENLTAMEPGSGTSIMAYAGVCPPNVQNKSDAFYHSASLDEIGNYVTTGFGSSCGTATAGANTSPIADAGANYTIPFGTPFTLTGAGTDAQTSALYYAWEQSDNQLNMQPPVGTNTGGPQFRAFLPTLSPKRTFPSMSNILSNTNNPWEVLPTVARSLNFTFVVRDFDANYGCTGHDSALITVANAGPFVLTSQNTITSIIGGSTQTFTWNVAGTNAAPINCANVDIVLSSDGGTTFTQVLATSVPNNGTHTLIFPNVTAAVPKARIMIRCSGSIFFDVNNKDFALEVGSSVVVVPITATSDPKNATCGDQNGEITVTPTSGTAPFTYAWSNSATTPKITNLSAGTYAVTITAADSATWSDTFVITNSIAPDIFKIDVYDASGTPNDNKVCAGIPINLGAYNTFGTGTGSQVWTWSTSSSIATFTGRTDGVFAGLDINNLGAVAEPVVVMIQITDSLGCKDSMTVDLLAQPKLSVSAAAFTDQSGTPNDHGICFGDSISFSAKAVPQGNYAYLWSSSQTTADITVTPPYNSMSTVYNVTITDNAGCTASDFNSAKGFPELVVSTQFLDICPAGSLDTIILMVKGGGPFLNDNYQFFVEGNTVGQFGVSPLVYSSSLAVGSTFDVLIVDEKGCKDSVAFVIPAENCVVDTTPTITPCTPATYQICAGESYTISTDAAATGLIQWYKDGVSIPGATNTNYVVNSVGTYTYKALNQTGCPVEGCCPVVFMPGTNCPMPPTCKPVICLPVSIIRN
jgi:Metallo-peptidase family M12B Reprolysin-like/SprB repeat